MISSEQAHAFTVGWLAAWNAHDNKVIHSHYEDGLTLSSPSIVKTTGEPSGRQARKEAVGAYWKNGLSLTPELHFGIKKFLSGMDSIMMICKALLESQPGYFVWPQRTNFFFHGVLRAMGFRLSQ